MSRVAIRGLLLVCLLAPCLLVAGATPAEAQVNQKRVLAIHVVRRDAPIIELGERVLRTTLTNGIPSLDYYSEYLDAARFGGQVYEQTFLEFLRRKYAGIRFDAVIASSTETLTFATKHRDELFPGVPIVWGASFNGPRAPLSTGVVVPFDLTATLEGAIQLHPELRRVVVVTGASEYDRSYEPPARAQFRAFEGRLQFTYLTGLPMAELLRQVAALPPDTIVYYLYMSEDGNGVHYVSVNAMREVAARASRPTYHWVAFTLGDGIVGGRMFDIEVVMKALADHVLRVLNGASPDSLPVREIDGTSQAYDWRALRRWGISEARLPVGSTVLFRQPSVWDQYKGYVAGAVALIVLQSALIGALVTQRMRRRRAELALLERERDAREAADQNRDLAGRLITAQEAERTRIARDLHDDLGQQMAGIGIILSGLKRKLGERAAPEALSATVEGLQDRTTSVTESIRHISHELHPTVLVHAGLGATLRRHCESIDEHRNVSVTYRTNDECDLRGDAALCLFRVAQEALANAVRHSGANRIHVELTSTHTRIELSIADDGCGFVPGSGTGLGLRSMAERVRLEHGTLAVESRIGHGTTLRASIPRAAVASGSRIPADTLA